MTIDDCARLEKGYKKRFSHPVRHLFAQFRYGYRFSKEEIPGYLRPVEAGMLYWWALELQPKSTIVEIGTLQGRSTCFLASAAKRSNSKVYAIDPFDSEPERQAYEGNAYYQNKLGIAKRTARKGRSILQKQSKDQVAATIVLQGLTDQVELVEGFSCEAVIGWERPIGFLWIDGNHDQVQQDYEAYRPFLRDGSRVAFHDAHPKYGFANVADYVKEVVRREHIDCLEQVKSITTFKLRLNCPS